MQLYKITVIKKMWLTEEKYNLIKISWYNVQRSHLNILQNLIKGQIKVNFHI